jgi:hypothetical protein
MVSQTHRPSKSFYYIIEYAHNATIESRVSKIRLRTTNQPDNQVMQSNNRARYSTFLETFEVIS